MHRGKFGSLGIVMALSSRNIFGHTVLLSMLQVNAMQDKQIVLLDDSSWDTFPSNDTNPQTAYRGFLCKSENQTVETMLGDCPMKTSYKCLLFRR